MGKGDGVQSGARAQGTSLEDGAGTETQLARAIEKRGAEATGIERQWERQLRRNSGTGN